MEHRVERISKKYDLTPAKAKDNIQKTDKKRASYYNYYTSKRWGEAKSYNLCVDSSVLGIDGTVEMLYQYIQHVSANRK
jgi:cytidylate kinase